MKTTKQFIKKSEINVMKLKKTGSRTSSKEYPKSNVQKH